MKQERDRIEAPFWIVLCPHNAAPSYPVRHSSQHEADMEAIRLAEKHPGMDFFVLRADHSYKAPVGLVQVSCHFESCERGIPAQTVAASFTSAP